MKSRPQRNARYLSTPRLAELEIEAKEAVVPLLQEIVKTVQAVEMLATEGVKPDAIEPKQAKLDALVIELFERIGIETYETEDIRQFITMLLRPDFQPSQPEELVVADLEREGTREAKLHFSQFVSDGFSDVEEAAERLLGRLVVFYTAHHKPLEYEPAVA
jgi:hypothetical protein